MKILRKDKLIKLKRKNQGNLRLIKAVDKFIEDIEKSEWQDKLELIGSRPDADRVHNDDIFFFDIYGHRTLSLFVFYENYAEILWVGSHSDYDSTFKGNKKTIETWLRNHGKIK